MRRSTLSCLAVGLLVTACEMAPVGAEFSGLDLAPGPHLLLDDYLIESTSGVRRIVNSPTRDPRIPNPLVTGTEDGNITPYFSVLREGHRFRLWYNAAVDDRGSNASHLGYMESPDGIHWQRPHRELPGPPGGIRFGASVVPRPEGGYALGFYQNGGLKIATSPDGFAWNLVHPKELIRHDHDIAGLTYDPIRGRYIGILSVLRPHDVGGIANRASRMTLQSVSEDLLHWEPPWEVLTPDFRDHEGTEFYAMDGFLARGDLLVAMVKILRDDLDVAGSARGELPARGMGYTSLAWSRDGRTWTRDRAVFLAPDSTPGTWDHAFAWIDQQVPVGDSVYLYYGGYATGHKGDRSSERTIGLATIPRDRYAGWGAGGNGGVLRSRLLRLHGSQLRFNVDAARGEMRVRVLDPDGRDLSGRCEPIRGDHLGAPLRCERDPADLQTPLRLEIELRDARLYAWTLLS